MPETFGLTASVEDLTKFALQVGNLYSARFGAPDTSEFALAKMVEELGEVMSADLKLRGHSRGHADKADLSDEIGDLFGFLLIYAAHEGIDPAKALHRKWSAYLEPPTG